MRGAAGNQAHLYRFDDGIFLEHVQEKDVVHLAGEFIDLDDGEIYTFTMDGVQQTRLSSEPRPLKPA